MIYQCLRSVWIHGWLSLSAVIVSSSFYPTYAFTPVLETDRPLIIDQEFAQQTEPRDRFIQPDSQPKIPLPEETGPVLSPSPSESPPPTAEPEQSDVTISVSQIEVVGSTVFGPEQLTPIIEPLEGRAVTLAELRGAGDKITELYVKQGYVTSRAILAEQDIVGGIVQIQVIEGRLQEDGIQIEGDERLGNYVRSRIALGTDSPLRTDHLEDQLLMLRDDPLIEKISASLKPGDEEGESILVVKMKEANPFTAEFSADNYSPPILGAERFGVELGYGNLTGLGDRISASYKHSSGRNNLWDFKYRIPFNALDGAVQLRAFLSRSEFTNTQSFNLINQGEITQETLNLTLSSDYDIYEGSIRQPIIRTPREELALSFGFSHRNGFPLEALQATELPSILADFLAEVGLEPGLQELGFLSPDLNQDKTSVFKFGADYLTRDRQGVWVLRSQFNLGTGLLDATIRPDPLPDGRFFSWLFQAQRVQRLGADNLLIISADLQLAADPLLASEQFIIGGGQSLRGFRQNVRFGDNGFRVSIEDRIFLEKNKRGEPIWQLAPFIDIGQVWNNGSNPFSLPSQTFLAGIGAGLIWTPTRQLSVRLDFAAPLVNLRDRGNNAQDDGVYFNVIYRP